MKSKKRSKVVVASNRARSHLKSRKGKNRSIAETNVGSVNKRLKQSWVERLRDKLRPSFKVFNRHYQMWGSKLDMIVFLAIITSIPTGYFGKLLTPILLYYTYVVLLVCFRIFMHWDFFYMACRMIALKIELGLTKGKGFHNEFEVKNVRKN